MLKGIVGQCVFQLGVMYALVFHSDIFFHIDMENTDLHGTIVFNTFVLMQLVNQVCFETKVERYPPQQSQTNENLLGIMLKGFSMTVWRIEWTVLYRIPGE